MLTMHAYELNILTNNQVHCLEIDKEKDSPRCPKAITLRLIHIKSVHFTVLSIRFI